MKSTKSKLKISKLNGLRIAICQMKVVPGRPDINTANIINYIQEAKRRQVDIIIFPEMCVTGYIIGDKYEDTYFIGNVQIYNEQIKAATTGGITVVFGSVLSCPDQKGENGRPRIHNAAFIAQDGKWVGWTVKFLHPNYRFFFDDRFFYSLRKFREEQIETMRKANGDYDKTLFNLENYLSPFTVQTSQGKIKIGVIVCEDMWHDDYFYNPAKVLADSGAEIIFNISASPWTWQKNRRRHIVVKKLLAECKVPFVYVNNTGAQNTGKNVIVFDGSSTIYNRRGDRIFEFPAYQDGVLDFVMNEKAPVLEEKPLEDTAELYNALKCAVKEMFATLPPHMRHAVIGLSGGIDSAVSIALLVDVLGAENVTTINMPTRFNSQETKDIAEQIAKNLGVEYLIKPIGKIADAIAEMMEIESGSFDYGNVMARSRMEVLAAYAGKNQCVFIANCNKDEIAFGYTTMYADQAGFMSPLGDLIKREVYQIGGYMNRVIYGREVIPQSCFEIAPTAELENAQVDPFDYGNLHRRGYHDEMVRAFTEFRRNPQWLLELYAQGKLEQELLLDPGTISRLFPTPIEFIRDLERCWNLFCNSYFKRVQAPPIPVVSKRAFGTDLAESIMWPYYTLRFKIIKEALLN